MLDTANHRTPVIPPRDPNVTDERTRLRLGGQNLAFYRLLARRDRVTNAELAKLALKYTSRISDLRDIGCIITCDPVHGRDGVFAYTMRDPAWSPRPGYSVTAHQDTREIKAVRTDRRGRVWVIYTRPRTLGVIRCLLGSWRRWATPIARPDIGAGAQRAASKSSPRRRSAR